MHSADDPAAWQNFYIMIGNANAAITGLLYVAMSIHLRDILRHPIFKPRAIHRFFDLSMHDRRRFVHDLCSDTAALSR